MRPHHGMLAPDFEATDLAGAPWSLARELSTGPVLLSFLRYASCPMCLLRLDELARRAPALKVASVGMVVVLHSARERILRHVRRDLPSRVIPSAAGGTIVRAHDGAGMGDHLAPAGDVDAMAARTCANDALSSAAIASRSRKLFSYAGASVGRFSILRPIEAGASCLERRAAGRHQAALRVDPAQALRTA